MALPIRNPSVLRRLPLRLGFVALTDAAPIIVAQENGLFIKRGLDVVLSREIGWATVRDKIIYGELDAAHAPAPMLWSTSLGLDCAATPVTTALVLNLHGNALTLSRALWEAGVRDGASLRKEARGRTGERKLTFGVVFRYSSHHLLLRSWLRAAGVNPDRDVRIVVVPPAQMFRTLTTGTIDGYCVGEPWNSLATSEGAGWCPTWSAAHNPGHVEKVLMVTERFASKRSDEHTSLVAALHEAAEWCDCAGHRPQLAAMLAARRFLNLSPELILPALTGRFDRGLAGIEAIPNFHIFHAQGASVPTPEKALRLHRELVAEHLLHTHEPATDLCSRLFREDIFREAVSPAPRMHETLSSL